MTVFSAISPQSPRAHTRAHVVPIVLGGTAAMCAVALVAYLLWPTWGPSGVNAPDKLPVSVGGTLFNVPTNAIRMKIQRHSGPQERIDLDFLYPSLEPPGAPKHVTADSVDAAMQPIDRIFLSIAAHRDALSPEQRTATIYPRYLDRAAATPQDGLTMRMFRADTPYGNEDLYSAASSCTDRALHAGCGDARHVPRRTPRRRRRPHLPLSAQLAIAVARCGGSDGEADGATARPEGLSAASAPRASKTKTAKTTPCTVAKCLA